MNFYKSFWAFNKGGIFLALFSFLVFLSQSPNGTILGPFQTLFGILFIPLIVVFVALGGESISLLNDLNASPMQNTLVTAVFFYIVGGIIGFLFHLLFSQNP